MLDLGISTLILAQNVGGSSSYGDGKTSVQILGEYDYKRTINPFLIAGFQYKYFDNPSYSVPIRFGYRLPIFNAYQTANWKIIDRIKNTTTFEIGRKTGFASYFTIGLEFKL